MKAQEIIRKRQAATKAEAVLNGWSAEGQKKLEAKLKKERNVKILKEAEMVYQAYLHAGKEVAEERKRLYIERNI